MSYEDITDQEFDAILLELMEEENMEFILQIPGVYEVVSEHFNNAVLDRYEEIKYYEEEKYYEKDN